jgi:hypothetical protein
MDVVADLTAAQPAVTLDQPDDLGSFKVLAVAPGEDAAALARALDGVGTLAGDGHAFIAVEAVRRLAGDRAEDPEWAAGFDKMLAYAGSKGWMDPSGTAIQAHVEWQAA